MTIVAERVFTVTVKIEAPTIAALDDASVDVHHRLEGAIPGRVHGLRVIAKNVTRNVREKSAVQ